MHIYDAHDTGSQRDHPPMATRFLYANRMPSHDPACYRLQGGKAVRHDTSSARNLRNAQGDCANVKAASYAFLLAGPAWKRPAMTEPTDMNETTELPVADPDAELPAPGEAPERISLAVRLAVLVAIIAPLLAVMAAPSSFGAGASAGPTWASCSACTS